ncbi:hypothetical protein MXL46_19035 [Heyndrickxia sporothermodurans]|uniref:hypothetical protein n=1 Tax=Bacillaceae TaxID=186817 RepID=UPI0010F63341|nr:MULTISPECIES: hypothetical protein [Bacillaceae]MEB6551143.1 hypothetical protein [Heyndrickxia sporothermodurans]MED3781867.1 hypothetical protein [Heyndrickxia sporothermodurans]QTR71170.1 hypothetical protein JC775_00235 [Bacillus cytotoxicus]HDR7314290.1 hypothetical protein [Bacillus cytotoxicus]
MEKKYSTNILFGCSIKDIKENSDAFSLMGSHLIQSLSLLSTVINIIFADESLSIEAKNHLDRFNNIKSFKGELPTYSEELWSIEEFTILTIMLRSVSRKRYDSMKKTIESYMETDNPPSEKVIEANKKWLLEAYNCLGNLKYYQWSKNITKDWLLIFFKKNFDYEKIQLNIQEIETIIKKSGMLEGEFDSIIGQILAKCAYPELLKSNQKSLSIKLIDAIAEVMYALESIEGVQPQEIAIIQSIKALGKLKDDIEYNYNVSKYFTDTYWEQVMEKKQNEEVLSFIKETLTKKFAVELDTIEKNSL